MRAVSIRTVFSAVIMLAAMTGCGGGGSTPSTSTSAVQALNKSTQFSLSGTPRSTVTAGQSFSFTPSVSNSSGTLTFSIQSAPGWASFNSSTGTLSGTPQVADAGTYANIVISASNGQTTVSLPAFSITVAEAGSGTADISWMPPTTNTNGSTLTDLAGYRIHFGTSPGSLTQTVDISNVGLTDYVVEGLPSGTWYFAVTAYTSSGVESSLSNLASKTIS